MRRLTYTNPQGASIVLGPAPATYAIESLEGLGSPSLSAETSKAPYQDGESYIDGTFEPREIEIEGAIRIAHDLEAIMTARRELVRVLNPKLGPGSLLIEYDGGTKRVTCLPQDTPSFSNKEFRDPWQRFRLRLLCPDPYLLSASPGSASLGLVEAAFSFPVEIPAAGIELSTRVSDKERTVVNAGDVPAPVVLVFYGPATNPTILNSTTGEYIRVLATLAEGERMEIDTRFGQKSITLYRGEGASNGMQYLDLGSTFWSLAVGENILTFYDDTSSLLPRCDVGWSDRYIGV